MEKENDQLSDKIAAGGATSSGVVDDERFKRVKSERDQNQKKIDELMKELERYR